jgi:hemerythrin-like domain-containing protein
MRISVTLLQYDHGIVRQVLDVVGEVLRTHRASKHVPDLQEALAFLDQFLDRFHHAKEELFFFPAAAQDCPKVRDELVKLKDEHSHARDLLKVAIKALDDGELDEAENVMKELVELMTVHITEEENQVFPVVEAAMQVETDAKVHEQYERFMEKEFGKSYYNVAESFANDIQERLLGSGFFKGIA